MKVNWQMFLLCPYEGCSSVFEKLKKNKNIKIVPIKRNYFNFKNENFSIFALNKGIITPNYTNALMIPLWNALQREVSFIEIYGADFSSFKGFKVNQQNNEVTLNNSHFYKNTIGQKNPHKKFRYRRRKKIHQSLYNIWMAFYQIYLISSVAKKKKN